MGLEDVENGCKVLEVGDASACDTGGETPQDVCIVLRSATFFPFFAKCHGTLEGHSENDTRHTEPVIETARTMTTFSVLFCLASDVMSFKCWIGCRVRNGRVAGLVFGCLLVSAFIADEVTVCLQRHCAMTCLLCCQTVLDWGLLGT